MLAFVTQKALVDGGFLELLFNIACSLERISKDENMYSINLLKMK